MFLLFKICSRIRSKILSRFSFRIYTNMSPKHEFTSSKSLTVWTS